MMDKQELDKILVHFRYEWSQMFRAANLLRDNVTQQDALPDGAWQAYLESFLVHARSLIDMLYRGRQHPSDVDPVDFLQNPSSWERPDYTDNVKNLRQRMNTRLAHLSTDRTKSPTNVVWEVGAIINVISPSVQKLDEQVRKEGVVQLLSESERELFGREWDFRPGT